VNLALATVLLSLSAVLQAQEIVPRPAKITPGGGRFVLGPGTRIAATGEAQLEAEKLRGYLRPATGLIAPSCAALLRGVRSIV
jgi:hexosaminidase